MSNGRRLQFPPGAVPLPIPSAMPQNQQIMVNGGPLVNDTQLIAWMAAVGPAVEPEAAVERAVKVLLEAIRQAPGFTAAAAAIHEECRKKDAKAG